MKLTDTDIRQLKRDLHLAMCGCSEGWDNGEPNGRCPKCDFPTVGGEAAQGCDYSSIECATCGCANCEGAC